MPFNRINSRSIQNVESQAEAQERVSAGEPQDLLNSIMDPNREQRLNGQFLRARRSIGVTFLQDQLAERIRQSQQDTYVVKPGDTLWDIAISHNISLDQLIAANPKINNPNLIFPDQVINLPRNRTTEPTPPPVVDD